MYVYILVCHISRQNCGPLSKNFNYFFLRNSICSKQSFAQDSFFKISLKITDENLFSVSEINKRQFVILNWFSM